MTGEQLVVPHRQLKTRLGWLSKLREVLQPTPSYQFTSRADFLEARQAERQAFLNSSPQEQASFLEALASATYDTSQQAISIHEIPVGDAARRSYTYVGPNGYPIDVRNYRPLRLVPDGEKPHASCIAEVRICRIRSDLDLPPFVLTDRCPETNPGTLRVPLDASLARKDDQERLNLLDLLQDINEITLARNYKRPYPLPAQTQT